MNNSIIVSTLPVDILRLIREYGDINELFNTCKSLYELKKYVYIWKLNKKYSLKYFYERDFRTLVRSKMEYSHKQLCINLSNTDIIGLNTLDNIYILNISYTKIKDNQSVHRLKNIDTLIMTNNMGLAAYIFCGQSVDGVKNIIVKPTPTNYSQHLIRGFGGLTFSN